MLIALSINSHVVEKRSNIPKLDLSGYTYCFNYYAQIIVKWSTNLCCSRRKESIVSALKILFVSSYASSLAIKLIKDIGHHNPWYKSFDYFLRVQKNTVTGITVNIFCLFVDSKIQVHIKLSVCSNYDLLNRTIPNLRLNQQRTSLIFATSKIQIRLPTHRNETGVYRNYLYDHLTRCTKCKERAKIKDLILHMAAYISFKGFCMGLGAFVCKDRVTTKCFFS